MRKKNLSYIAIRTSRSGANPTLLITIGIVKMKQMAIFCNTDAITAMVLYKNLYASQNDVQTIAMIQTFLRISDL